MRKYLNAAGWVMAGICINAVGLALVVNGVLDMPVLNSATNPNAGFMRLFFKSDGLYYRTSAGIETKVGSGGGGGGGETWSVNLNDFTRTSGTGTAEQESDGSISFNSASSARYRYNGAAFGVGKTLAAALDWTAKPSDYWTFTVGVESSTCSGTNPGRYRFDIYSNADNRLYFWIRKEKCDGSGMDGDVYSWTNHFVPNSMKLRVRDDGANLHFEFCPSGQIAASGPWKTLASVERTSYITADRAYFAADGGVCMKIRQFAVQ